MKLNLGLFCDVSNLFYCIGKKFPDRKLDYEKYLQHVEGTENNLWTVNAYGVQRGNEAANFIKCLQHFGYRTQYRPPKIYDDEKARRLSWNVGISTDVFRSYLKLDTVVLGSADPELQDLVKWIREQGLHCKILACGISKELKEVANSWEEISKELLEDETQVPTEQ